MKRVYWPCFAAALCAVASARAQAAGAATSEELARAVVVDDCSGVLVSPRRVVTAAHCARPGTTPKAATFGMLLGGKPFRVRISKCKSHPQYRDRGPQFDLAVCDLDQPVHRIGHVTVTRALALGTLASGDRVRVIGFGEPAASTNTDRLNRVGVVSQASPRGISGLISVSACFGDSGAPVYAIRRSGAALLVGVVSGRASIACADETTTSRTAPVRDFIVSDI